MLKIKQKGFTLAEVLITLGVIGVVAMLTLPSLLINYKKHETAVKVKEAYSIFSQAIKLSVEENGQISGWDTSVIANVAPKYINPYLKGVRKANGSLYSYPMRTLSSQGDHANNRYAYWSSNMTTEPIYILPNGMFFVYKKFYNEVQCIVVDINGSGKPNIMGIDGFAFQILPEFSSIAPLGYQYSRDKLLSGKDGCECVRDNIWQYYRGGCCAALIQKDGWRISKDYPWGNGGLTKK